MKKLLIVVLLFSFILTPFHAFADEQEQEASDTFVPVHTVSEVPEQKNLDIRIRLLKVLDIVRGDPDGNLRLGDTITRAEFTALAMRMLGLTSLEGNENYEDIFKDVPHEHWAGGVITRAFQLGLINGIDEYTFAPEDSVTYAQTLKILVEALGYGAMANSYGGYPAGYAMAANEIGILKQINRTGETPAVREDVFSLIYNTLLTEPADITYGANQSISRPNKGDVLLTKVFDVDYVHGVVTAVDFLDISKNPSTRAYRDMVKIEEDIYKIGFTDINKYFAYNVTAYYQTGKNDDEKTIIAYKVSESRNDIREIALTDVEEITLSGNIVEVIYSDASNGNRKTLRTASSPTLIYNGKIVNTLPEPVQGTLTAYNTNSGSGYNVLYMMQYRDLRVKDINVSRDFIVYGENGKQVSLLQDSTNEVVRVYLNGEAVEKEEVKKGDVLSVAQSNDRDVTVALISRKYVTGVLEQRSSDNREIVLDGEHYELSKDFYTNNEKDLILGQPATIYLNTFGYGAYAELGDAKNRDQYGYLIAASVARGLSDSTEFMILTESNELKSFTAASNVRFTNYDRAERLISDKALAESLISKNGDNFSVPHDVIVYATNTDGSLTKLAFPKSSPDANYLSLDAKYAHRIFSNGTLTDYENTYIVSEDTIVFDIYDSIEFYKRFSSGGSHKYLKQDGSYQVKLYDVENSVIGAIVNLNGIEAGMLNGILFRPTYVDRVNSDVMLITSISQMLAENGEIVNAVTGIVNGAERSVAISDAYYSSLPLGYLSTGDVIQYETNYKELGFAAQDETKVEQIIVVKKLFDESEPVREIRYNYETIYNTNPQITTAFGTVLEVGDSYIIIGFENGSSVPFLLGDDIYAARYNKDSKKADVVPVLDIRTGDTVFIRQMYKDTQEIFIYSKKI